MTSPLSDRGIGTVEPQCCAREASEFLTDTQATLSRRRREKVGPPFLQVGGVYRYNPVTVRSWVREQETAHG